MNASVWIDQQVSLSPPLTAVPREADVVIIGGGYTGLHAARELARRGKQVAVLEQGRIGDGASGLNFGSAALGVAAPYSSLAKRYGPDFARATATLSTRVLKDFCEFITKEQIKCDLRKTGHLTIALNQRQLNQLARAKSTLDELGDNELVLFSRSNVKEHLNIDSAWGGLFNPNSYAINPITYLQGLIKLALRAGAGVFEETKVQEISRLGDELFEVRCDKNTLRSKHVIVCTNGVPLRGFKPSERGIVPINSYLIATEILSDTDAKAISQMVFSTAHLVPSYFRITPDNRLLFGSRKNLAAEPSPSRDTRELVARMHALLPFTRDLKITHSWSGKLGFTFDRLPHVGVADGIHYAMGYCGKGIPWSAFCGIAVANLVADGVTPEQPVAMPVMQRWFYNGSRTFLHPLSWYCRLVDSLS